MPQAASHATNLSQLLADLITARDPKAKVAPGSERWQTDMRRLVDNDGRSVLDVEKVIRWCQDDEFWAPNILSPGKLRKQFAGLWGHMNRGRNGGQAPGRDFSRFDKAVQR